MTTDTSCRLILVLPYPIVSSVSFAPKEITVGSSTTVNVSLAPTNDALSEVVVTALGIRRFEKALGYAVSKVDPGTR